LTNFFAISRNGEKSIQYMINMLLSIKLVSHFQSAEVNSKVNSNINRFTWWRLDMIFWRTTFSDVYRTSIVATYCQSYITR